MTKIHLSGLVEVCKPWIMSLVCKPVLLLNSDVFLLFGVEAGWNNSSLCFSLPNWSNLYCRFAERVLHIYNHVPCLTGCISLQQGFRPWITLEGSHVVVVWGFCCTKFDSFLLIFGRSISKGTLSTTRGLKIYPAVLQGQRNFKAFADVSGT